MERKDQLDKQEVEAYVGPNANYYLDNWETYHTGINSTAFFFPTQWLGYRKMYAKAGLSYLFMFLIYFLVALLATALDLKIYPFYSFIVARLLLGAFFALMGNDLYRKKFISCIQDYNKISDRNRYLDFLKESGGKNIWFPILLGLIDIWLFYSTYASMIYYSNYTATFVY